MGGIITRVLSSLDSGAPTSNTASAALPQPVGPDLQAAEEQRRLRRAFFGFFGTALQNQLTEAFLLQPREVQERMLGALVSGAMDAGDPQVRFGSGKRRAKRNRYGRGGVGFRSWFPLRNLCH